MKRSWFKRKSKSRIQGYTPRYCPNYCKNPKEDRIVQNRATRRTLKQQDKFMKGFYEFVEENKKEGKIK